MSKWVTVLALAVMIQMTGEQNGKKVTTVMACTPADAVEVEGYLESVPYAEITSEIVLEDPRS